MENENLKKILKQKKDENSEDPIEGLEEDQLNEISGGKTDTDLSTDPPPVCDGGGAYYSCSGTKFKVQGG